MFPMNSEFDTAVSILREWSTAMNLVDQRAQWELIPEFPRPSGYLSCTLSISSENMLNKYSNVPMLELIETVTYAIALMQLRRKNLPFDFTYRGRHINYLMNAGRTRAAAKYEEEQDAK